ncbi:hypothetical protein BDZ89DRAFT_687064 [Hymenopellis radicata]|nr:hypothetical protein BDZ89DRAFT_687064 [Hymenopellis radicata]
MMMMDEVACTGRKERTLTIRVLSRCQRVGVSMSWLRDEKRIQASDHVPITRLQVLGGYHRSRLLFLLLVFHTVIIYRQLGCWLPTWKGRQPRGRKCGSMYCHL